jgi:hypothetical protein
MLEKKTRPKILKTANTTLRYKRVVHEISPSSLPLLNTRESGISKMRGTTMIDPTLMDPYKPTRLTMAV